MDGFEISELRLHGEQVGALAAERPIDLSQNLLELHVLMFSHIFVRRRVFLYKLL